VSFDYALGINSPLFGPIFLQFIPFNVESLV
jgi:hypothetical protein